MDWRRQCFRYQTQSRRDGYWFDCWHGMTQHQLGMARTSRGLWRIVCALVYWSSYRATRTWARWWEIGDEWVWTRIKNVAGNRTLIRDIYFEAIVHARLRSFSIIRNRYKAAENVSKFLSRETIHCHAFVIHVDWDGKTCGSSIWGGEKMEISKHKKSRTYPLRRNRYPSCLFCRICSSGTTQPSVHKGKTCPWPYLFHFGLTVCYKDMILICIWTVMLWLKIYLP